mmetsp:Transcript_67545/g.213837  ORF Transcript_67545/g.213837 Transcript_67545/m.213837 type:complete len:265 (-) Transcript_67545:1272-2066(-)
MHLLLLPGLRAAQRRFPLSQRSLLCTRQGWGIPSRPRPHDAALPYDEELGVVGAHHPPRGRAPTGRPSPHPHYPGLRHRLRNCAARGGALRHIPLEGRYGLEGRGGHPGGRHGAHDPWTHEPHVRDQRGAARHHHRQVQARELRYFLAHPPAVDASLRAPLPPLGGVLQVVLLAAGNVRGRQADRQDAGTQGGGALARGTRSQRDGRDEYPHAGAHRGQAALPLQSRAVPLHQLPHALPARVAPLHHHLGPRGGPRQRAHALVA